MRTLIEFTETEIHDPDLSAGYVYGSSFVAQKYYDAIDGVTKKVVDDSDVEQVMYYHAYTPEEIAQREQAEQEAAHQELIDALPDAVADLSVLFSEGATSMEDIADALADLSAIVSTLVEGA